MFITTQTPLASNLKFVRPNKGLPLTFLIVGEGKSIGGEDIWLVKEFGYNKTFGALKRETHALQLSPLMAEQVAHWLSMIDFKNPACASL